MIKSLVLELATFINGCFLFSKHSEYTSLINFTKKVVIHHPMVNVTDQMSTASLSDTT